MVKALISTGVLAALLFGTGAPAHASTFDKRTYFTFSQPVALPGVTLPAGTYTFRLVTPFADPKVVQVMDRAATRSYAMLLTLPATRLDAPTTPGIVFMETGAGMPSAVSSWWYPGEKTGYEFIYPQDQLRRLTLGVPPEPASLVARKSTPAGESAAVGESAAAASVDTSPTTTSTDDAEVSAQPPAQVAQDSSSAPARQDVREELPRTASPIWMALALGMFGTCFGLIMLSLARSA